jgi:hypothetical protein
MVCEALHLSSCICCLLRARSSLPGWLRFPGQSRPGGQDGRYYGEQRGAAFKGQAGKGVARGPHHVVVAVLTITWWWLCSCRPILAADVECTVLRGTWSVPWILAIGCVHCAYPAQAGRAGLRPSAFAYILTNFVGAMITMLANMAGFSGIEHEADGECPISFYPLDGAPGGECMVSTAEATPATVATTPCGHLFHAECLAGSMRADRKYGRPAELPDVPQASSRLNARRS